MYDILPDFYAIFSMLQVTGAVKIDAWIKVKCFFLSSKIIGREKHIYQILSPAVPWTGHKVITVGGGGWR